MRTTRLLFALTCISAFLSIPSWADTEKVLHSFPGTPNGSGPNGVLARDSDGNLYGVTSNGGTSGVINVGQCWQSGGCGVVFELSPLTTGGWKETILYNFCPAKGCKDGANPVGGLVRDSASGKLYGATHAGGLGAGVVFEMSLVDGKWHETVLHSFCSSANCDDGELPGGGVILDGKGNLYGTTTGGEGIGTSQYGSVYELTPVATGWEEKVLHDFCKVAFCKDGANPHGRLAFDKVGNLYGTVYAGGTGNGGLVFKLTAVTKGAWPYSVLHEFCSLSGCADGEDPLGGVTFNSAGHIFGTTYYGGKENAGVVYELALDAGKWDESVLHSFCSDKASSGRCLDGSNPTNEVIFDTPGNLYGTTQLGAAGNGGTLYKLTPSATVWTETVMHGFCVKAGCPDGNQPSGTPSFNADGDLLGTTGGGGTGVPSAAGVVYEVIP
jgi:uncharacterized repeat protein (TIGR03803 family)